MTPASAEGKVGYQKRLSAGKQETLSYGALGIISSVKRLLAAQVSDFLTDSRGFAPQRQRTHVAVASRQLLESGPLMLATAELQQPFTHGKHVMTGLGIGAKKPLHLRMAVQDG